jgi:hypothetical protein
MLRSLHMLALALATTLGIASSVAATTAETALRANRDCDVPRVTDFASQACEAHQQSALGYGETASDSSLAAGAGARTAEEAGISAADAARIQNAATRTNQRITVVGSRAEGTAKAGSDWDYIMSGRSAQRHSATSSVPRGTAGGEVNRPGIDVWQDYNPNAPGYNRLDPSRPHVTFDPWGLP